MAAQRRRCLDSLDSGLGFLCLVRCTKKKWRWLTRIWIGKQNPEHGGTVRWDYAFHWGICAKGIHRRVQVLWTKRSWQPVYSPGDVDSSIQPCDLNFDLNYGWKKWLKTVDFPQVGPYMLGISMLIARPSFTSLWAWPSNLANPNSKVGFPNSNHWIRGKLIIGSNQGGTPQLSEML